MKQTIFTIAANRPLTADVWEMKLTGDTSEITAPGQFVNIKLEGMFLRWPISICDWDDKGLTLIYKVVGKGTEFMTGLPVGKELDILIGLGNGFDIAKCGQKTLVIGGGVGVPPMYGLAKALLSGRRHRSVSPEKRRILSESVPLAGQTHDSPHAPLEF